MTETDISQRAKRIVLSYPQDRKHALAAMQDMQREFNYVPKAGLELLTAHLGCSLAQLYSMATFYKALSLVPKGRHIVKICNGTACHLRGAANLAAQLERDLGAGPGQTTPDGEFSVEFVNCLGSCALAPVVVVDGVYHNRLGVDSVSDVVAAHTQDKEA